MGLEGFSIFIILFLSNKISHDKLCQSTKIIRKMEKILNFSLIQVSYDRNLSYFPPVVLNIGDDSFLVQTPDAHRALFFFKNKNRFGVSCLVFYCPFSSRLERSC